MRPKIAALITASGGIGSHFVLHKLQGHRSIITLKESAFRGQAGSTKGDLKRYVSQGALPNLDPEQLHPKKQIAGPENEWIIMNKPPLKMINYHRTFHPDLPVLYIYRNPVSFYLTWIKKWKEYGNRRYSRTLTDEQVFDWFKVTFMSSLFELAQNFNPKRDCIISFEHFFSNIDFELSRIYDCLGVEDIKSEDLMVLDRCNVCGTENIEVKEIEVRSGRKEDVLFCPTHGPILGPGEYNYIRKENSSFLNKWKQEKNAKSLTNRFKNLFGTELIEYYEKEEYTTDKDRIVFDRLFYKFLDGLRV